MLERNLRLGKVFGISIEINFSWFIVVILITWTLAKGYFPYFYPALSKTTYWLLGLIAAVFLFISVLLHELSHCFVAKYHGMSIKRITLFMFGGVAQITQDARRPSIEFKMAIAGPICSFGLMLIFMSLAFLCRRFGCDILIIALFKYLALINGMLGGFNLIPAFPLDGGRLLRAGIWYFTKSLKKATFIASEIGKGFAFLLILFGFLRAFAGNLMGGLWFVLIGFFLQGAAEAGYLQVLLRRALTGVVVNDIMDKNPITVNSFITLEELVDNYFFKYRHTSFPVADEGQLKGVVKLDNVKNVLKEKWGNTKVEDVMDKSVIKISLKPHEPISRIVNRVIHNGGGSLPVVENNQLVGVLSYSEIVQLLKISADLGD